MHTKSLFHHLFIIGLNIALLALALLILAHVQHTSAVLNTASITPTEDTEEVPSGEEPAETEELRSILIENELYPLPFGAAEIHGYYTTVERATSLDDSTDPVICSAFVVTEAPEALMVPLETLPTIDKVDGHPVAVIGSGDSYFGAISDSSEENPVTVLVTTKASFEGELISCMQYPFGEWTIVE